MIRARQTLARLTRSEEASTIVEFAFLAPIVIGFMLGTLQIGSMMQSYNAIRNVTADTARYALVEYQKGNEPTNAAIRTQAISIADGAPYLLNPQYLTINVADAATQRVVGIKEISITVSYATPTTLPLLDFIAPTVSHTRPIFVSTGPIV